MSKLQEYRKQLEAAHEEVSAICRGKDWRMCIPARQDDSDLLIGGALRRAMRLVDLAEAVKHCAETHGWHRGMHPEHVAVLDRLAALEG